MAKEIKIVQVCFNVTDPFQKELYDKVIRQYNRSAYIKRLIESEDRKSVSVISDGEFSPNDFI